MREAGVVDDVKTRHRALRVGAFRNYAGWMDTKGFAEGLDRMKAIAAGEEGWVVVMCAETVWWRCHRRMVADRLVAEGGREVRHLGVGKGGEGMRHELWGVARWDRDSGGLVYDVEGG